MRERKYRAYDTTNHAWIYSDHMPGLAWFFDLLEKGGFEYVLEDWTGKYDKDGKEIYEGDVLEGSNGIKAIVEWTQEFGRWSMRWSDRSTTPISWHVKHAIVIGNVHCGIARELLQTLKEG